MKRFFTLLPLVFCLSMVRAQDDLLSLLGEDEPQIEYATASFKTNHVINLHSLENTGFGVFDFKISHRFNSVKDGVYDLFGLDGATIRLGGDYGVTDYLQVGIGRSTIEKTVDGYLKYKFLRQSTGKRNMPISAILFASTAVNTLKWADPDRENYFSSRLSYAFQLIIGRKFSEGFSLQLSPTVIHRNLVASKAEKNDTYAIGIAARQKITKRVALNLEYIFLLPDQLPDDRKSSLSVGFDIETGGHVFQLHFTNSVAMYEKGFVTDTRDLWGDGQIHFGFNISRVFTFVRRKE